MALEIEAELTDEPYSASRAELKGIERGWRDAEQGKFVSEEDVEAVFAKYRRK